MIPKIIHYCWFGGSPLPGSAKKCIDSWRKFLPDYEIWVWVEQQPLSTSLPKERELYADKVMAFDVNSIAYTKEAYKAKKYAFVSDYARFDILYQYGGIYFDTDVEALKPMDDIIDKGPFMGREAGAYLCNICDGFEGNGLAVAPGLGLGVSPGHSLYKEFLDAYKDFSFLNEDGSLNTKTIVSYTSEILVKHGLNSENDTPQLVAGVWIYPADVFCPMDHTKGRYVKITEDTRTIHHYDASWLNHNTLRYKLSLIKKWYVRTIEEIRDKYTDGE